MNLAGYYIRISSGDSAEIRLTSSFVSRNRYHVEGLALWGENRQFGPNLGQLDFTADVEGDCLKHEASNGQETYRIVLRFEKGLLFVTEQNWLGVHGMNVTFDGTYKRASAISGPFRLLGHAIKRLLAR